MVVFQLVISCNFEHEVSDVLKAHSIFKSTTYAKTILELGGR